MAEEVHLLDDLDAPGNDDVEGGTDPTFPDDGLAGGKGLEAGGSLLGIMGGSILGAMGGGTVVGVTG